MLGVLLGHAGDAKQACSVCFWDTLRKGAQHSKTFKSAEAVEAKVVRDILGTIGTRWG